MLAHAHLVAQRNRQRVEHVRKGFCDGVQGRVNAPEDGELGLSRCAKPDLRNVPLRGFRMCKDFVYQGDDQWSEGTLYDPNNGSTYQGTITMRDMNTLDMRGYIGVEAIGRTDVWKRLKMPSRKKKK